ncbi:hypothetical protein [Candidatus Deianiraea vastatrix]|uniref:Uncharacterized protein n=1 Tax=Candidatus Deianiraea vastatrix TaxID=2163644 RepID=A0A5B8XEK9_9RICK|nr:hypothetical protein [Candidatus Deianiraea vastatrix]QED23703.1 hypothetical protein Deia_00916 [Candidatus Deianiraea vastatrix]
MYIKNRKKASSTVMIALYLAIILGLFAIVASSVSVMMNLWKITTFNKEVSEYSEAIWKFKIAYHSWPGDLPKANLVGSLKPLASNIPSNTNQSYGDGNVSNLNSDKQALAWASMAMSGILEPSKVPSANSTITPVMTTQALSGFLPRSKIATNASWMFYVSKDATTNYSSDGTLTKYTAPIMQNATYNRWSTEFSNQPFLFLAGNITNSSITGTDILFNTDQVNGRPIGAISASFAQQISTKISDGKPHGDKSQLIFEPGGSSNAGCGNYPTKLDKVITQPQGNPTGCVESQSGTMPCSCTTGPSSCSWQKNGAYKCGCSGGTVPYNCSWSSSTPPNNCVCSVAATSYVAPYGCTYNSSGGYYCNNCPYTSSYSNCTGGNTTGSKAQTTCSTSNKYPSSCTAVVTTCGWTNTGSCTGTHGYATWSASSLPDTVRLENSIYGIYVQAVFSKVASNGDILNSSGAKSTLSLSYNFKLANGATCYSSSTSISNVGYTCSGCDPTTTYIYSTSGSATCYCDEAKNYISGGSCTYSSANTNQKCNCNPSIAATNPSGCTWKPTSAESSYTCSCSNPYSCSYNSSGASTCTCTPASGCTYNASGAYKCNCTGAVVPEQSYNQTVIDWSQMTTKASFTNTKFSGSKSANPSDACTVWIPLKK